ncbi:MAG: hypothetical protein Q4G60_07615 [bacterium]|nr:hypothetical protein [bacterium]
MKKRLIKVCAAVIGFALIIGFTTRTVSGKEQKPEHPTVNAYETMEAEYLTEIKAVLAQNHYSNSGVNMTKIIDADENRYYTIEIYHARLSQADIAQKQQLISQLEALSGFGEYGTVEYQIAM